MKHQYLVTIATMIAFGSFSDAGVTKIKEKDTKAITSAVIELQKPRVALSFSIFKAAHGLNDPGKEIYFDGVRECAAGNSTGMAGLDLSHTGKCLFFHTQFSAERWHTVPVEQLTAVDETMIKSDLKKIYKSTGIEVAQNGKEKYGWGEVFNWSTETQGSAHYMYLNLPENNFSIRIGPIASSVLSNYKFDFKNAKWKFASTEVSHCVLWSDLASVYKK